MSTIDITDRKKAEQRAIESEQNTRAILDSISDTIILLDLDGRILDVNTNQIGQLNMTREEFIDTSIFDYANY